MNSNYTKYYVLLTLILIVISSSFASDTIILRNSTRLIDVSSSIHIYEDATAELPLELIIDKQFIRTNKKVANLGISKSVFWVKIPIKNMSNQNHFLINLSVPTIDFIEFYYLDKNNKYLVNEMGEHLPFNNRIYDDPDYIFDLIISPGESKVVYFKIASKEGIQLPIKIGTEGTILGQIKNKGILSGIYFGIMLVIIFYNLFIYFSIKDNSYLYYVSYVLLILLTQTSLQGYTFQFLWPNSPVLAQTSLFTLPSLVGISAMLFMNSFLHLKYFSKTLHFIGLGLILPYLLSIVLFLLNYFKASQVSMEINAMIVSVYMLVTPIIILRRGFKPAKFFLLAWSVFLIGVCIYVLKDLEILPFNNFTRYTMQIGSAIETVLLSFALADRINILKKEKEMSQALTLEALKENEKLITEQNIQLEKNVEERTLELKKTLSSLKDTQAQLVSAEKMASLGQLTAGIAHEINNPINFVSANIKPLKMDIDDVLELVKKYETIPKNDTTINELKKIDEFKQKIDFEYIKKEMQLLLNGIDDGARRTAEIVYGLKNFSRLDETEIKEVNINEGIQSTLLLLNSSVQNHTEVIVNLGEIPLIECLPGKLNQVFMNLLSNAIFAINSKKNNSGGKLIISSYSSNSQVFVLIEDTGIGMTEEVKNKLFEPFFTTKGVGEGTGLGMSIVFKIIESHGAKIEVESEHGVGTKILVILNAKIAANRS
ncbi:MAG: 7TM diverse intracellular signaling domain-containing protein [Bacteroidota bacterium]|nr:7TM diverse intracellular signaling domain-containing protein [Bacteroidota bacterium]MDP3145909.1 7TM diverse intracellular signaling domain-containing protein [Bacteroidota bacterium]